VVEEVLSNIYKIEVPLPGNPLKVLNTYLIKGRGRNLLIDTGFNQEECREALFNGLSILGAALEETDIFITHLHADHCGLVSSLAREQSVIYCGEVDAERINWSLSPTYWSENLAFTGSYGFPLRDLSKAMQKHPGQKYSPDSEQAFSTVSENDIIEVGDYRFTCVETPGHTPGHICLYEPDRKVLVSGDHILENITPNVTMFLKGLADPLGQYLKSLDKVDRMDISLVLPGHRRIMSDVRKRIAELKQHYENRLNEVLNVLNNGRMSAYQVASQITWDLTYTSWEQFPLEQKWFATGEAISHLEHLRQMNKVRRFQNKENLLFELIA
jgi:glyoxylase-like metal-dependent hydrolase (beta-lactamase superfamily II)